MADRIYRLDDPTRFFRVRGAGHYARWDAPTRTWVAVAKGGRDFLSRAVETGDAWPLQADEIAARGFQSA